MSNFKSAVDDLIEETRMRELDDEQVEWRVRKFTETCRDVIEARVSDPRKRKMLIERLQIMKCFYDHSSVKHTALGVAQRDEDPRERNRRLSKIVQRRRMTLEMIERTEPSTAREIRKSLERVFREPIPEGVGAPEYRSLPPAEPQAHLMHELSPQQWYFLYFNLFLLACLILTIILVVD